MESKLFCMVITPKKEFYVTHQPNEVHPGDKNEVLHMMVQQMVTPIGSYLMG